MPPRPFPYPFIGDLLHLNTKSTTPFRNLIEKYGDIFTIYLMTRNVVLNAASLAREARLGRNKIEVLGVSPESVYH